MLQLVNLPLSQPAALQFARGASGAVHCQQAVLSAEPQRPHPFALGHVALSGQNELVWSAFLARVSNRLVPFFPKRNLYKQPKTILCKPKLPFCAASTNLRLSKSKSIGCSNLHVDLNLPEIFVNYSCSLMNLKLHTKAVEFDFNGCFQKIS